VTGKPVLSMVDSNSFHVEGYFEETKLKGIHIGSPVDIRVMGEKRVLHGHVQSIAAGIEDRDRTNGSNLLPNVNPTFNWVRLAQRVPVRIQFDQMPEDVRLVAGRTATVSVKADDEKNIGKRKTSRPRRRPAVVPRRTRLRWPASARPQPEQCSETLCPCLAGGDVAACAGRLHDRRP
jgi:multidrug resistance efflux pump